MGRAFPGGAQLAGAAGSDRALLALGVEFGPSHTRSRTGVQPSFVHVKSQQHWTFHGKDNSSPGETYFSMYFSWTLWLLTRTKSSGCNASKDFLVSYLIKCYFYVFCVFLHSNGNNREGRVRWYPNYEYYTSKWSPTVLYSKKQKIILFAPALGLPLNKLYSSEQVHLQGLKVTEF